MLLVANTAEAQDKLPWRDASLPRDWVLAGDPRLRLAPISTSPDGFSLTEARTCSAGSFHWRYALDETLYVLEGSATLGEPAGTVRHLGPGDVLLLRAGTTVTWTIPCQVRTLAFLHAPVPFPARLPLRALRSLCARFVRLPPLAAA